MYRHIVRDFVQFLKELGKLQIDSDTGVGYLDMLDCKDESIKRATLIKSDGTTLYLTRDIVAALHRMQAFKADQLLYVVENSQHRHFEQLQQAVKQLSSAGTAKDWFSLNKSVPVDDNSYKSLMCCKQTDDFPSASENSQQMEKCGAVNSKGCEIKHVKFGRIEGVSSRKGEGVLLKDVLGKSKELALNIMKQKHTTKLSDAAEQLRVAEAVAVSAILVQDFKEYRMNSYQFNWDKFLNFNGDTGSFLQYSHARLHRFDEVILKSFMDLEPVHLTQYLFTLGRILNVVHGELYVKNQPADLAKARLQLYKSAKTVLKIGMRLLGLTPLDRL